MKILYILHLFFASVLSMGPREIQGVSAVTNDCISRDTNVTNPTESDEPDGRKPSTPTDNTENKKPSPFLCFFQKRTNSIRRRKISYSSQTSQSSVHSRSSTSSDPATLTEETSSQTAEDLSPQTITSIQNPGYGIDSAPSPTKCAIPENDFGYEPPRCNRVLPDIPCTSDANGRSASQLPMENQTSAPPENFYANSTNPQENDVFCSIFCFDVKSSSFIRENSRLEASSAKKKRS